MKKILVTYPSRNIPLSKNVKEEIIDGMGRYGRVLTVRSYDESIVIEFSDERDAKDAIYDMDGRFFEEVKISVMRYNRVKHSKALSDLKTFSSLKVRLKKISELLSELCREVKYMQTQLNC